ncbi:MAG: flagellar filament capping protein FliD [Selenomonadaceae bacterium]|nr:flagellar filament capping protein FliD [Selenomonadaceae bacterium]
MGVNGIYGLSGSGLDVESMVKVGMMSKQSEYDKMKQKYTKNEWTKAAYVDVYGKIQTFNNSTLSQYKMSANMNARNAESSNSEIKATANASAPQMTHYVEVGKAATNAYLIGTGTATRLGDSRTSTQLRDTLYKNVTAVGDNVTTTDSNGNTSIHSKRDVAFKFAVSDKANGNLTSSNEDVVTATASASAANGSHTVNITETAKNVSLTSKLSSVKRYDTTTAPVHNPPNSGSSSLNLKDMMFQNITTDGTTTTVYNPADPPTNPNGSSNSKSVIANSDLSTTNALEFTLSDGKNSATISLTYEDIITNNATIETLADKINAAGLNITAAYDSTAGTFSLTNNEVGSANEISISIEGNTADNKIGTNTSRFLGNLGLKDSLNGTTQIFSSSDTTSVNGTDAQGTVDGNAVTFSGNNATVDGITYNAKDVGESTVKVEQNVVSVTYGQLAEGFTFNDLTVAVNNLGTNVKATYDSVNDKFSFYNSSTGDENGVSLAMADADDGGTTAANFFNSIGLQQSKDGSLVGAVMNDFSAGTSTSVAGTNAQVKVDGMSYDIADNKLVVNGVTYNFTGATEGTRSTVTITQDTDKIIDKVKSFVEDYNKLLKELTDMYNEKPNKNYKPLTDSQRDAMKDEQIEKWEEKAKAGMLYHDQTLGKLITEMRSAVSTPVDGIAGKYNSIFSIGISTTGVKGQLTLDEDKLKAALTDDPEAVYNVFAKLDANDYNDSAKSGVAQRLGDVFTKNMKSIKSVSGTDMNTADDSDLSKLMRELQTKMSNFKSMMNAFEDKLYKKYDAMETMLARLGTQLGYVTSSFS